jgi:multidrug efflux pump subunit AcrA (membrane-fusion protein)
MKLLRILPIIFSVTMLFIIPPFVVSCSKKAADDSTQEKTLYTCGMHPQIIQDHPGNCPICGMKLTPIRKQPAANSATQNPSPGERKIKYYKSTMMASEIRQTPGKDSVGMDMVPVYDGGAESKAISVDAVTIQKMGVRTGIVTKGPLRHVIRTVGVIDYNETALADVTTKFRGWLENLYVDSTGKQVKKGDPLFDIYSPDLYSAQNEYVLALNQSGGEGMKASARLKLKLYDISDDQIAELEKTRQPQKTLRVSAPIDGIVVEKIAVQGQMVDAGMKLYHLADLGIVWVQAQIYEQDLAFLKLGQEAQVSLSYLPDRKFSGRVTYIYPTVDDKTRTARVRMEFHNPGLFLKPGMFATVELQTKLEPSVLLVPDMAVLRSGEKNTVFVALDGGRFEPRTVILGSRAENNTYQVLSGLKEGESVVTSGQFMFDSESQLREAIQKMLKPGVTATPIAEQAQSGSTPAKVAVINTSETAPSAWVCPMPEHESIKYDHPGKCPICGMTMIPFTAEKKYDSAAPSPSPATNAPGMVMPKP